MPKLVLRVLPNMQSEVGSNCTRPCSPRVVYLWHRPLRHSTEASRQRLHGLASMRDAMALSATRHGHLPKCKLQLQYLLYATAECLQLLRALSSMLRAEVSTLPQFSRLFFADMQHAASK